MSETAALVSEFLAQKRLAVAGVSRNGREAANAIYEKLKKSGYEVFALNPNADTVEGDPCYAHVGAIPGGVDGVVISTKPEITVAVVRDCIDAGVPRVWMHRSLAGGSVSDEAVQLCQQHDIAVIAGGCPMMFCQPVDFGHKCMRWIGQISGAVPK